MMGSSHPTDNIREIQDEINKINWDFVLHQSSLKLASGAPDALGNFFVPANAALVNLTTKGNVHSEFVYYI